MLFQFIEVVDPIGNIVATAEVKDKGKYYSGRVNLDKMPKYLRLKLEEYESLINDRVFSLIERLEEEINLASFKIIFENGAKLNVRDLQIFPQYRTISFVI